MDNIRQYLLSITAAAVICAIINALSGKKGTTSAVVKLLSGLFLTLSVISPLLNLEHLDFSLFSGDLTEQAASAALQGERMAFDAVGEIIKQRTQAYILDKAASMDLDIEVEVQLDDTDLPKPCAVAIKGTVSPYSREVLSQYIANNLAIAKEDQQWS